jgi:hypothetical protein
MTLHPIPLNFIIYEENFILFFIRVSSLKCSFFQSPASECEPNGNSNLFAFSEQDSFPMYSQFVFKI